MVCICIVSLFIIYLQLHAMGYDKREPGGYCEISTNKIFAEPINTWSNLGFIIIGFIIAWQMMWGTFNDNVNNLTTSDFLSIFYSSLVICLGPCSMTMHATYTHLGMELDVLSEYLICGYLVAYSTQRLFCMNKIYFVGVFLLIVVICELVSRCDIYLPVIGGPANLLVAIFLIIFLIAELFIVFYRKSDIKKRWGILGILAFILAFLIWNFSNTGGPLCFPNSWFQGHALWHVLCAIALYFLFRYHISENSSARSSLLTNSF
ncbi:hypothetical protein I4U23_004097 [Adineta vaga]|nr:hypothetical protein I4U23_004097 [Adineta vaga]